MTIYYIGLGGDCSPAAVLRNLNLRPFALPFDWVVSSADTLCAAIFDKFSNYHDRLRVSHTNTAVVDAYGFTFPHDYPTIETAAVPTDEDTGPNETTLHPEWHTHIRTVQEKYRRRIDRFMALMTSPDPLIMVHRGSIHNVDKFKATFLACFNKTNIAYVVATTEQATAPDVFTCQPESNGDWNNKDIWAVALKAAADYLEMPK